MNTYHIFLAREIHKPMNIICQVTTVYYILLANGVAVVQDVHLHYQSYYYIFMDLWISLAGKM